MSEERYSMKDDFFNPRTAKLMTDSIAQAWSEFNSEGCLKDIVEGFEGLELKERMNHIRVCLETYLKKDYKKNIEIMTKALLISGQGHFVFGAFCEYVAVNGCNDQYVDLSLESLGLFTKYFSAEFAIRPFINAYPKKTFDAMMTWSRSDDVHQRRLASEGLRPKLPWAKGIDFDYRQGMKALDNLYLDSERYVTRSVANHLNDVSKINPEAVIATLKRWKDEGKQSASEMAYIINHSTRTLIKRGYGPALELLGYKYDQEVMIDGFMVITPSLIIGDSLEFTFNLSVSEDAHLMVDYIIDYPMSKGKRTSKVFKIKKLKLKQGQQITVKKKHPFKIMTTKKLYSGTYKVILQINGKQYDSGEFVLTV